MNRLEHWLQEWLGVDPPGPGQDFWWNVRLPWAWPSWLILLFLIAAAVYFLAIYRREGTTASMRLKAFLSLLRWSLAGLLLLMLFELDLLVDRRALPYLVLLVDDSESMNITDQYSDSATESAAKAMLLAAGQSEPRRLNLAKSLLLQQNADFMQRLVRNHRLRVYQVSGGARELAECDTDAELPAVLQKLRALEATGVESRLGSSLREVLAELGGTPPAAIVYLTDGVNTDGEPLTEVAASAARKGVPLYTVGIGDTRPARDIELHDLLVDDVVFVNDVVNFDAKLTARGVEAGKATVRLRLKDQETPLATQEVDLTRASQTIPLRLQYRPTKAGEATFVVDVTPIEREFKTQNNRLERTISVREEKLRVLYVESYPRFQYRFLKHLIERDPTIELNTLMLEADIQHPEQDKTAISHFPTSKDELRSYDVILFGDVNPLYLNEGQLRNLADFVLDKGGGLVLIAGPRYMPLSYRETPLESVIPVALDSASAGTPTRDPFRIALTVEGRANPIFQLGGNEAETEQVLRNLPGHYWFFEAPERKPGAVPLATHPARAGEQGPLPLCLLQYSGAGKVIMLLFDSTWRWRDQVGDVYFARFWVQTIRYLSRSRLLGQSRQAELATDRREYVKGQSVDIRIRFLDESLVANPDEEVSVSIEREGHGESRQRLRRARSSEAVYESRLTGVTEGSYRVSLVTPVVQGAAPNALFSVTAPPGEFRRIEMDQTVLRQAADKSGGKFYPLTAAAGLVRDIPPGRKIPLDTDPPIPLWNTWPLLALFSAVLVTEWVIRKRLRML
jgi:hypothetical protein